uniref:Nudix hydrolase domain-containing protein n=1 Tax=Trichuris muris TaxID=70415 RepID=A0A5S6Q1W6_TRIMR
MVNRKCRNSVYRSTKIKRFPVPDEQVPWEVPYPEYSPPEYNANVLKTAPWADPDLSNAAFNPKFNSLDGNVDRRSRNGTYKVVGGRPINPVGRTGLSGRGVLGKWGPNHAVDVIVSRWKRNESGEIERNELSGKPLLQFLAIVRRDTGEFAIPGGMIDAGENVTEAQQREFLEETLNYEKASTKRRRELEKLIEAPFKSGVEIYSGYVDDPRNTDNAWMETIASNFHDEMGQGLGKAFYSAGSDAADVDWITLDRSRAFYASHGDILAKLANTLAAHW